MIEAIADSAADNYFRLTDLAESAISPANIDGLDDPIAAVMLPFHHVSLQFAFALDNDGIEYLICRLESYTRRSFCAIDRLILHVYLSDCI